MDINDVRIVVTMVSLLLFVALVAHTWSRRRAAEHSAAAVLPFLDDEAARPGPAGQGEGRE
jgi:cytochrome c oxidase cbb3-type subunit IV